MNLIQDWFSRSAEENVAMLNRDSEITGVYGFRYCKEDEEPEEIPGMNRVSYQLPGDPEGGRYVGYEPYEKTYAKEKRAYETAVQEGTLSSEAAHRYEKASSVYGDQREAYRLYRKENPGAPDYLKEKNPVDSYALYEKVRRKDEAIREERAKADRMAEAKKEAVSHGFGDGHEKKEEALTVKKESEKNKDKEKEKEPVKSTEPERVPQDYVIRRAETLDQSSVQGMQNYLKQAGRDVQTRRDLSDPDAYGKELVGQLHMMDEELKKSDSSYKSGLPEHLQYYKADENPLAVPGMTLVVGEIEGVPGYYAGYESYDTTYGNAMAEADEEADKIEKASEKGASTKELAERSDQNRLRYQNASDLYDFQKKQYVNYVKENPQNDFLNSNDAVKAFQEYQEGKSQGKEFDFIKNVKEFLVTKWNDLVKNMDQMAKRVEATLNRRAVVPDDKTMVNGPEQDVSAAEPVVSADQNPAGKKVTDKNPDKNISDKNISIPAAEYSGDAMHSKNVFDSILNASTQADAYRSKYDMSGKSGNVYTGSTGVTMLDEMNRGEEYSVTKLMNSLSGVESLESETGSSKASVGKAKGVSKAERLAAREADVSMEQPKQTGAKKTSSKLDKLAGLSVRLDQAAVSDLAEDIPLPGKSFG